MKNFPSKVLLWGSAFIVLKGTNLAAQPIQLIPHKRDSVGPVRPLPIQEVKGFWEGTPPSLIESYYPKLPLHLTSSTLRHLRGEVLKEKYTLLLQNPSYEKTLLLLLMEGGQLEQAKELLLETNLPEKDSLFLDLQWLGKEQNKVQIKWPLDNAAGDKKIFVTVVVEVGKQRAPAPIGGRHPTDQSDVAKADAIAVVALQTIPRILVLVTVPGDLLHIGVKVFTIAVSL